MLEPHVIDLTRKAINTAEYRHTYASRDDFSSLITDSTIIRDSSSRRVSIVYLVLEDDCLAITETLQAFRFYEQARTAGMPTVSRIFGFKPRVTIRDDFCSTTALARENPEGHALIASYAEKVATYYQRYNPSLYDMHSQAVTRVLPEWTLENSVFTSGIINKNNTLPYHFDTGNFKNVWSNMLVFRAGTSGGYLSVPEYDLGFEVRNNSLLMFDGQNLLHGVTPIEMIEESGYRYSIVYYSLQQMWNCLPPSEEVERIKTIRTRREDERLDRDRTGTKLDGKKRQKSA